MIYTAADINEVIGTRPLEAGKDNRVAYLLTDSRRVAFPPLSLFFAIRSPTGDGHSYIAELYARGVRSFVVELDFSPDGMDDAAWIFVEESVEALQALAAFHRSKFDIPVYGITGSNGKTIVKEWLFQLLSPHKMIVRSPRSYNSQTGVPLSVWLLDENTEAGLFEAGISRPGEMDRLERVIRPTTGVLTSIGAAHGENFGSLRQKLLEKCVLFRNCERLVFGEESIASLLDIRGGDASLFRAGVKLFSWSRRDVSAFLFVEREEATANGMRIFFRHAQRSFSASTVFSDRPSVDNAITCCCALLAEGMAYEDIVRGLAALRPLDMRLQTRKGTGGSHLLNDFYNNDLSSLSLVLDVLVQQAGGQPAAVVLSDLLQTGIPHRELYEKVAAEIAARPISLFIGIGPEISSGEPFIRQALAAEKVQVAFFQSTEAFLDRIDRSWLRNHYVLLKGSRKFGFERISLSLEEKVHQTVLEVNLSALAHNLRQYRQMLDPGIKMMAMVKAFGYGSGSVEVARVLQYHQVDYLGLAYADEGVELRKAGIRVPIMIMNTEPSAFEQLVQYNLEPELFSFGILTAFLEFARSQGIRDYPVHIKLDTGMHRLGFGPGEIVGLAGFLKGAPEFRVVSVFSHLAASEDPLEESFTRTQAASFTKACDELQRQIGYGFIRHLANSAAISRYPEDRLDMVRLGIGLYGFDPAHAKQLDLQPVGSLYTTIAQLRKVKKGDTVGYNRQGRVDRDSLIAVIRIGYADGFFRSLGNGRGKVCVIGRGRGRLVPVLGNICMDMTMIDVTDLGSEDLQEGDRVEIFGTHLNVNTLAQWAETIPYEILTSIGQRVQRVYVEEQS